MRPYLRAPYSGIARVLAGALVIVTLVGTGWVAGYTTKVHRARAARERSCAERIETQAAKHGYSVIRLAAFPCMEAR